MIYNVMPIKKIMFLCIIKFQVNQQTISQSENLKMLLMNRERTILSSMYCFGLVFNLQFKDYLTTLFSSVFQCRK